VPLRRRAKGSTANAKQFQFSATPLGPGIDPRECEGERSEKIISLGFPGNARIAGSLGTAAGETMLMTEKDEQALWVRLNALEFVLQEVVCRNMFREPDARAKMTAFKDDVLRDQDRIPVRLTHQVDRDELERWQHEILGSATQLFDQLILRAAGGGSESGGNRVIEYE
jgi:hypothetical protein